MGISVADNFSYLGGKPLDGRIQYATLASMKAMADATLYEGCEAYCVATDKYYQWKSTNTVDASTGKWREVESGGTGGGHTIYNDNTAMTQRSGLEFIGFNVSDDSSGDKTVVSMPNIDLSMLSPEAFIFDTSEKPVGMWHNRKLLYVKTYTGLNVTPQYDTWTNIAQAPTNIDEMTFVLLARREQNSLLSTGIGIEFYVNNGYIGAECTQNVSLRPINELTVFYTKTTDSPLPSDEKYAGLLSNGTVVYKKTVATGGSAPSGTTLIYRLPLLNNTDVVYFTR